MNKQQINSVLTLILNQLGVQEKKINEYSEYSNDFGFSERELNLFYYYLEKYFGISVLPTDEVNLSNVNTTVSFVQTQILR